MRAVGTEQVTFKSININDIKYTDNRDKQRKKQIYAVLNRFKKAIQIMFSRSSIKGTKNSLCKRVTEGVEGKG